MHTHLIKKLFSCTLIFGLASMAFAGSQTPPKLGNNIRKANASAMATHHAVNSKNKTGIVKPSKGIYLNWWNNEVENWTDSSKFSRTYFTDGKLKNEYWFNYITGDTTDWFEHIYDQKGYLDYRVGHHYPGGNSVIITDISKKIYDNQNRLTHYESYSVSGDDTLSSRNDVDLEYYTDSCIVKFYNELSEAPDMLSEIVVLSGKSGIDNYSVIKDMYWNESSSSYGSTSYSNVQWNGGFQAERLIGVKDYDVIMLYALINFKDQNGVPGVAKFEGTVSTNKDTETWSIQKALVFVPEERQSYLRDSHSNISQDLYEYGWNSITQKFDTAYSTDYINKYSGDNLVNTFVRDYEPSFMYNREEFRYSDFIDVANGISELDHTSLQLWPNPTSGILNFTTESEIESIIISDFTGKHISVKTSHTDNKYSVDMSNLPAGSYVLSATAKNKIFKQIILVGK